MIIKRAFYFIRRLLQGAPMGQPNAETYRPRYSDISSKWKKV